MIDLKQIAVDLLHGKLPQMAIKDLSDKRMGVCTQCEYMARLSRQCRLCGCFLDAKVKLLEAECPMQKW